MKNQQQKSQVLSKIQDKTNKFLVEKQANYYILHSSYKFL